MVKRLQSTTKHELNTDFSGVEIAKTCDWKDKLGTCYF